ncbi:MAG: ABC transporter substrate-binding protein [Acidobacteria bacterium]|nr:ABC transporter substrate-binding protein [Acidobacteriota bacterium]
MKFQRTLIALLAALCLLAAACGDDDSGDDNSAEATTTASAQADETTSSEAVDTSEKEAAFPLTLSTDDGEITIESRPERIVSLSPTATEMLFAVGAGDQVVAVDDFSYYPDEAPVQEGLSGFNTNIEAVAGFEPDLIVVQAPIEGMDVLDVPVLVQFAPPDLAGSYSQIEQIGAATGNVGGAAEVVANMTTEIATIVADVDPSAETRTYFHEVGTEYYAATSQTFAGEIYAMFGLENIADAADPDGMFGGYPEMSEEAIVASNPDFIFLADTIGYAQSAETVAQRPGWDQITAVKDGNIVELNDDIASRWGPRVVELVAAIAEGVKIADSVEAG